MYLVSSIVSLFLFSTSALGADTCAYTVQESFDYYKNKFPEAIHAATVEEFGQKDYLEFENQGFGDADVPYLCSLTQLTTLKIYNDGAEGLEMLSGINLNPINLLTKLETLDLDGNQIPGTALSQLPDLKNLRYFKLGRGNPVGPSGILEATQAWTALESIDLFNSNISGADIQWVKELERSLSLSLGGNKGITNQDLLLFKEAKVSSLGIEYTGINSSENFEVLAANDNLTQINISGNALTAEELVKVLEKLSVSKSLKVLNYGDLPKTPEVIQALVNIPWLSSIAISDTELLPEPIAQDQLVAALDPILETASGKEIQLNLSTVQTASVPFIKGFCTAVLEQHPGEKLLVSMFGGGKAFNCAQLPF